MRNIQLDILGKNFMIEKLSADKLPGINLGEKISFDFYAGTVRGTEMLFLKPRGGNPSPKKCSTISERLSQLFGKPIVFILVPGPTYERQRLLEKNVYFTMSSKYASLPMLAAIENVSSRKKPERLTPVAQYLLLYHLQIENIENMSIKAIASLMPYSYESVSIGLTCLADTGLCEKVEKDLRGRSVRFKSSGKKLWKEAGKYLVSPVEKHIYCDAVKTEKEFPKCGINALAHFTRLNPDAERWIMMTGKEFRKISSEGSLINPNEFDGDNIIEIWKYPAVRKKGHKAEWVDRLSLALSLRENEDPRVEEEVEQLVDGFPWSD